MSLYLYFPCHLPSHTYLCLTCQHQASLSAPPCKFQYKTLSPQTLLCACFPGKLELHVSQERQTFIHLPKLDSSDIINIYYVCVHIILEIEISISVWQFAEQFTCTLSSHYTLVQIRPRFLNFKQTRTIEIYKK